MAAGHAHHELGHARGHLLEIPLHAGFALAGAGTVLLGTILPQVSAQWHLRDKDAGLLLLVQFAGSASGALLTRGRLWKTQAAGFGLCGSAAVLISTLQQSSSSQLLVVFGLFGLGLGLAMTSTNLLVSRRYAQRRGSALALLNFSWSAGAVVCPLFVAHVFSRFQGSHFFGVIGACLLPCTLLPLLFRDPAWHVASQESLTAGRRPQAPTIAYFALVAFLYVGVESAVGNWISTYATRVETGVLAGGSLTAAIFWAAFVAGRGVTPLLLGLLQEQRVYQTSPVVVVFGVGVLLFAKTAASAMIGAAVSGFSLAPLFPLILSSFLAEAGESRNAGWVFALAGFGGGVFSWLTGAVSSFTRSLRAGLLLPGLAALCMMALIFIRKPARNRSSQVLPLS